MLMCSEPRSVSARIRRIASAMTRQRVSGSPSQPCPKLTIARGPADRRWATATRASSWALGPSSIRACEAGGPSSGCSEMQPMQAALHMVETGSAPSSRP